MSQDSALIHRSAPAHRPIPTTGRATGIVVVAACATVLAACGSSSGSSPASSGGSPSASASNGQLGSGRLSGGGEGGTGTGRGFGGAGFTPVTGKVATVGPSGAKVTTAKGSTDVAFASMTRFTTQSTSSLAAIKVGDCITASSLKAGTRPTPAASPSAQASNTPIKAVTISITSTTGCSARGAGFPGAGLPGGGSGSGTGGFGGGTPPSGAPTSAPGGSGTGSGTGTGTGTGRRGFGGFGATGTVSAISGSTITVKPAFGGTTKETVTTSSATTYISSTTGKASDVTAGKCLTAVGQTKSSIVDAFIVTITDPVNGKCVATTTGGFGAGFGGGAGGGFGGPAGGAGAVNG